MIKAIMLTESLEYQTKLFEKSLKEKIDDVNKKIFGNDKDSMKNDKVNKKIIDNFNFFSELKTKYQKIYEEYKKLIKVY